MSVDAADSSVLANRALHPIASSDILYSDFCDRMFVENAWLCFAT